MAILLDTSTGVQHALKPYHVFGRSTRHADCVLPTPDISLIHACARWEAPTWTLMDQSRNGSYINGRRLERDRASPVALGDEICFGSLEAAPWRVVDVAGPADLLLPLSLGQHTITLAPFQNLPDDAAPQICIYRSPHGQWVKETKDGVTLLNNGDTVYIGGHAWRLVCAEERACTLVPSTGLTGMVFQISLDERHVSLTLTRGHASLDLGERPHHHLLMLLARQRLADAAQGRDAHSQGWVAFDDLADRLHMDKAHLNIQIFRLRRHLEQAVAEGLIQHDFIERRSEGVRLGNVAVEIWKGAELEGAWRPDPMPGMAPVHQSA